MFGKKKEDDMKALKEELEYYKEKSKGGEDMPRRNYETEQLDDDEEEVSPAVPKELPKLKSKTDEKIDKVLDKAVQQAPIQLPRAVSEADQFNIIVDLLVSLHQKVDSLK